MKFWVTLAVIAQLLDIATLVAAVSKVGFWGESNPLMQWQYEWLGMEGIILVKGLAILLIIAAFVWRAPRFRVAFVLAALMGILGTSTNLMFGVFWT